MDLSVVLVFVLVLLISWWFTRKQVKLPPGRFTIPYIGTLGLLAKLRGKRPHEVFLEETRRLGKLFRWSIGNQLFVVLNGYDEIHEALVKKADVCSGRPTFLTTLLKFRPGEEGILFNQYGQSWRDLRRFTLQALRDFGVGKMSIEEKIVVEIDALTPILQKTKAEPTAVGDFMQKVIANIIIGIIFGKRYDFDDPEFDRARHIPNVLISGNGALSPSAFLPRFLSYLVNKQDPGILKERQAAADNMRRYVMDQIDEHETTFDGNNIRDFVDIYWRTVKNTNADERKHVTKSNMFRVITDLFRAGLETTSTALDWALLFMIEHPDVQRRCQDELQEVVGDRLVTYSDRNKLPYITATVMEIQRRASITPLSSAHVTTEDTTLGGYDIPKNTILLSNIYAVSMDPFCWTEPKKFNPNRFLTEGKLNNRVETLIPFSIGPRVCLGEPLARMELFLVFTILLQRFTFSRENDAIRHSFDSKLYNITNVPLPYKLRVHARA